MKALASLALFLALFLGLLAGSPAVAEPAVPACEVPAYLLTSDSSLPKVAEAVKAGKLDILVIGSRSSTIAKPDGTAYPGRMEAKLREAMPAVTVNVAVELQIKKTAEEAVADFSDLLATRKPALVIWQTGTVDAIRSVDPDDFRVAVGDGIAELKKAGADVVLINPQYSPRMETMISAAPYMDNMRVAAQQADVPLFDRFSMMRHWNESGEFDLFSTSHGLDLAKRVHDCLGQALTTFVISAAHIDPTERRTQR